MQVARLGSVKAAAEELSLSSPALSRRVQALERFVSKPLFERRHQAMRLNADGERLLAQMGPALDALSLAVESLILPAEMMRLRLGVPPLFATQRLMPQLGELVSRHPALHIDVDTAPHSLTRLGDGLDVAITLSRDVDSALYSHRLDRNRVFIVGSRALVEREDPVVRPEQIAGLTALVHRDRPDDLRAWLRAAGLDGMEPRAIDHFDSGPLMLEAAAHGLGVAIMLDSHYRDANDPRLVRLFEIEVESLYSYWFVCRPRALESRAVRLFHDWAIEALIV